MNYARKRNLAILAIVILALAWPAWWLNNEFHKAASEDPTVWQSDIDALTEGAPPGPGAFLFVGSSSIRLWDTIVEDMAPLTVIQRGFGGAKLGDVVYHANALLRAEQPAALIVFAGTNDIHPGAVKEPATLLARYQELVTRTWQQHPNLDIYFIEITPTPLRWEVWDLAEQTNVLVREWSASNEKLHVIETTDAFLDAQGQPVEAYFRFDKLHLNEQGYAVWRKIIRDRLLTDFPEAAR